MQYQEITSEDQATIIANRIRELEAQHFIAVLSLEEINSTFDYYDKDEADKTRGGIHRECNILKQKIKALRGFAEPKPEAVEG